MGANVDALFRFSSILMRDGVNSTEEKYDSDSRGNYQEHLHSRVGHAWYQEW